MSDAPPRPARSRLSPAERERVRLARLEAARVRKAQAQEREDVKRSGERWAVVKWEEQVTDFIEREAMRDGRVRRLVRVHRLEDGWWVGVLPLPLSWRWVRAR